MVTCSSFIVPQRNADELFVHFAKIINLQLAMSKATTPKIAGILESKLKTLIADNIALTIEAYSLYASKLVVTDGGDEYALASAAVVDKLRSAGDVAYTWEEMFAAKKHDPINHANLLFKGREVDGVDFDSLVTIPLSSLLPMPLRKITADVARKMLAIKTAVSTCTACLLHTTRSQTVPGEGYLAPHIVFVGEGPGENEDRTGRPFVGRAGDLLDDLLKGSNIERSKVFITNIVKCRPPANRTPTIAETRSCRAFLEQQLQALDPLLIVTLGASAIKWFAPTSSMSHARGNIFMWNGKQVLPTYHPAGVLRTRKLLPLVQQDFARINDVIREER